MRDERVTRRGATVAVLLRSATGVPVSAALIAIDRESLRVGSVRWRAQFLTRSGFWLGGRQGLATASGGACVGRQLCERRQRLYAHSNAPNPCISLITAYSLLTLCQPPFSPPPSSLLRGALARATRARGSSGKMTAELSLHVGSVTSPPLRWLGAASPVAWVMMRGCTASGAFLFHSLLLAVRASGQRGLSSVEVD
jgi:hypothetical protein